MRIDLARLLIRKAIPCLSGIGTRVVCTLALVSVLSGGVFSTTLRAQGFMQFQAIDLTDTTPGQDLWRYQYVLNGFTFQTGQGFSVFFDSQLYTDLHNPQPSLSPIWNVIAVQPDVILHQPGYFDGQALVNSPSLTDIFQVDFVWLGQGSPGLQNFSIYDVNFSTLSAGSTSVPEPQVLTFLSLGVLCLRAGKLCFKKASNFKA